MANMLEQYINDRFAKFNDPKILEVAKKAVKNPMLTERNGVIEGMPKWDSEAGLVILTALGFYADNFKEINLKSPIMKALAPNEPTMDYFLALQTLKMDDDAPYKMEARLKLALALVNNVHVNRMESWSEDTKILVESYPLEKLRDTMLAIIDTFFDKEEAVIGNTPLPSGSYVPLIAGNRMIVTRDEMNPYFDGHGDIDFPLNEFKVEEFAEALTYYRDGLLSKPATFQKIDYIAFVSFSEGCYTDVPVDLILKTYKMEELIFTKNLDLELKPYKTKDSWKTLLKDSQK